ncbi:unnamed protein product [Clonostachys rhizophaga]|uniref:Uncharacterized protein n=1 Tax=Clonostachys rhizophaga TaxID=160324 RepID=A0A9N9W1X5_9HYPO|nr:unnamed protein product [Clonostachys rhizophaga]
MEQPHDTACQIRHSGLVCGAQTPMSLKIDDGVFGAVPRIRLLTPRVGAFAAVVGANDINTIKIPDEVASDLAVSLGSGTARVALFKSLQVPWVLIHLVYLVNPLKMMIGG